MRVKRNESEREREREKSERESNLNLGRGHGVREMQLRELEQGVVSAWGSNSSTTRLSDSASLSPLSPSSLFSPLSFFQFKTTNTLDR